MCSQARALFFSANTAPAGVTTDLSPRPPHLLAVERVATERELIDRIESEEIHCGLIERDTPSATWRDTLDNVRTRCPEIPLIVLSREVNAEVIREAISAGATDCLVVPSNSDLPRHQTQRIYAHAERYRNSTSLATATFSQLSQQINRALAQTSSQSSAETQICERFVALQPFTGAWLVSWRPDADRVAVRAGTGTRPAFLPDGSEQLSSTGNQSLIRDAVRDCRIVEKNVQTAETKSQQLGAGEGADDTTAVAVPLAPDTTTSSGVLVITTNSTELTQSDRAKLRDVCADIANALPRFHSAPQMSHDVAETVFADAPFPVAHGQFGDGSQQLVSANSAFCETFDWNGESLPKTLRHIVPDDGTEQFDNIYTRVACGESVVTEATRVTYDGRRQFKLHVIPYGHSDSQPTATGWYTLYTDISALKNRERRLQRQNERLDTFASVVSHDLQNPLQIAMSRTDLLAAECESEHIDALMSAHRRMARLIDDLLTLARQGQQIEEVNQVDLGRLIRRCWDTIMSEDATLDIQTDIDIRADTDRLYQLLENLLRNSIKHTDGDVNITVGDLPDGFYIADDGPGIPAEARDDIFTSGYTTADDGSGIGLAIVRNIVEAHSWDISVTESRSGGCRFEITDADVID